MKTDTPRTLRKTVILLVGPEGAGKSTLAAALVSTYGSRRTRVVSLGQPLRDVIERVFHIPVADQVTQEDKARRYVQLAGHSLREAMVMIANNGFRAVNDRVWALCWIERATRLFGCVDPAVDSATVVCDDLRSPTDLATIQTWASANDVQVCVVKVHRRSVSDALAQRVIEHARWYNKLGRFLFGLPGCYHATDNDLSVVETAQFANYVFDNQISATVSGCVGMRMSPNYVNLLTYMMGRFGLVPRNMYAQVSDNPCAGVATPSTDTPLADCIRGYDVYDVASPDTGKALAEEQVQGLMGQFSGPDMPTPDREIKDDQRG